MLSVENHKALIEDFNLTDDATTLKKCLYQLLEQVAHKHVDKIAVICDGTNLTYGELNTLANRLARLLVKRGIERGDLVGVALNRSIDLVIVLMAVLKTGAAYVPIDAAFPAERIKQTLYDANPKLVVVCSSTISPLSSWAGACLDLDVDWKTTVSDGDGSNLNLNIQPDDLAYIIYTSGSTGRPKGVKITNGSLSNTILSMQQLTGCDEKDRLLAITTISFDIAALEIFLPLLCGATIVVALEHETKSSDTLYTLMINHQITMMQGTPSTWQMMLDYGWPSNGYRLAKILCGGEALSRRLADRLLAVCSSVWNMYGPTEATIWASSWKVQKHGEIIIGRPLTNYKLYVLDEGLAPVSLHSIGELYIGGSGLANGYHKNLNLTLSRFHENPFHEGLLYQTGDLARWLAPEQLSVLGRVDSQIKLRGHRIELSDIESAIMECEAISKTVVVSRDERLVAYCIRIVSRDKGPKSGSELSAILQPWLAERLPSYMMPAFFVDLDKFPMSPNGKIDHRSLPDPTKDIRNRLLTNPTTQLEEHILEVWSHVLGHSHIGLDDNFFQIGGDSIRLVQVQKELENTLSRQIGTTVLFQNYTIKTLAIYLADVGVAQASMKLESTHRRPHIYHNEEDIAIVSMACQFPGGITTPEEYWELLVNAGDAITDVPQDRWDSKGLYSEDPDSSGRSYCSRGGFLPSVDLFDAAFFGISPREASTLDPTHSLMLETCWEGFERAGYTSKQLRGSRTGVYIGISNIAAHQENIYNYADLNGYCCTGTAGGTLSGRVSYILGLEGPSMTIDTACSSSLVTTHLACTALRQGECDIALSGGITLMFTPGLYIEFSRLRGMSQDGRCRAFSDNTEGTGWAEGVAAIVLKRLSDAQRDGDTIHAILRSSTVNHGGRSPGLTIPNGLAQERLIRSALAAANLKPGDIDYIEAHGTATKLGDPIEGNSLAKIFGGDESRSRTEPLWIGSAKSNIGHTQAAAGLAGLLKVVLALQYSTLPQTLHITNPTPAIDWKAANMALLQEKRPWLGRENRLRRAGVSSFGIGGTNAHVIVEDYPNFAGLEMSRQQTLYNRLPFVFSGHTDTALRKQVEKFRLHLTKDMETARFIDTAYSLATTRNHLRHRLVLMAQNQMDLLEKLATIPSNTIRTPNGYIGETRLAMLFTGQGSQWPGMGKTLAKQYPVFQDALFNVASHFSSVLNESLLDIMWAEDSSEAAILLQRTDYAQPAVFSLEVAMWKLWESWGIQPKFVLGHSIGEYAAAYAAGVLNLSEACRLVAARSQLMYTLPIHGKMVSIEASAIDIEETITLLNLGKKVDIASINSPLQTVISGDIDGIDEISAYFTAKGRKAKALVASHAFHSHHMDDMLMEFSTIAEGTTFNPPILPIVSGYTGMLARPGQLEEATYWVEQTRGTVRFSDGIQTLIDHNVNIFLELGPRPVLCGIGAMCTAENKTTSIVWLPSLNPQRDSIKVIQGSLAELHVRHTPINWTEYFRPFGCRRVDLPTYAFQRERFRTKKAANVSPSTLKPSQNAGNQIRGGVKHYKFSIEWRQIEVTYHASGTWGLLSPTYELPWMEEAMLTLSKGGISLRKVSNFEDTKDLNGLLCFWCSTSDILCQTREFTIKALTQIQDAIASAFTLPLVWITNDAVGISAKDQAHGLGASILWGLMRTARNEHPEMNLRLLDLGKGTEDFGPLAQCLMLESEDQCAIRKGQVFVPRMEQIEPNLEKEQYTARDSLCRDGAVLITGGTGGIGQSVARWLVKKHGVRDLVLTSRRGIEAPGAKALVDDLALYNAKVTVIAGEIADISSIDNTLATFGKDRPLRGIVHAAGILDDSVLSALTLARCDALYKSKIDGAWHLHQRTKGMDLDFFVMFSSISGVMGTAGQGNYAAANTFLDSLAYLRRAENLPATSVAWGLWGGQGMGAKLSKTGRARYSHFGLHDLTPEDGLELFEQAVYDDRALTVAAAFDLNQLRNYYTDKNRRPSLLTSLLGLEACERNQNERLISTGKDGSSNLLERLRKASSEQQSAILLTAVQETMAPILGFASPNDINVHLPLQEIGIDSLTAILTRGQLAKVTGLTLSPRIVFDYPNLTALASFLLSQIHESWEASSSSEQRSDSSTSLSSIGLDGSILNMSAIRQGSLDPKLTFANSVDPECAHPRSVFITGGTGFVGAFIIYKLLILGIETHCLVRAISNDQATQRLIATLSDYGLWQPNFSSLLKLVVGDMTQPLLGLAQDKFNQLANQIDCICHSGALVDWMRPLEDYIRYNLISTHEVLRLASQGRAKTVHLISTVSTLPKYFGYEISKEEREYGYATSKYLAEQMVVAARWRGAKASVYRLPFVTASVSTGQFRRNRGDFLHNMIAGSIDMGWFPSLDADLSAVLPVDYLAGTIASLMIQDTSRIGDDFDFLDKNPLDLDDFFQLISTISGGQGLLPFAGWRQQALSYAAAHPTSSLARIAAVIDILTEESAAAMIRSSPVGRHVLGGEHYPVPAVDQQFARKYVDCIRTAYRRQGNST